jgi:hypothetical protein
MLGVDSNASQAALVNFEDGVESGPASAPALIYSDVMGHMFPGSDKWKLGGSVLITRLTSAGAARTHHR